MASLNAAIDQLMETEVTPAREETKLFKKTFYEFMAELLPILRHDPDFGILLEREDLVGSASSKLRVGMFNEFDVNLILKDFSSLTKRLQIYPSDQDGFVYFTLLEKMYYPNTSNKYIPPPGAEDWSEIYRALRDVQDDEGFIHPYKVVNKLYSAVVKAVRQISLSKPQFEIQDRRHYPAVTVTVSTRYQGKSISIDLVPVFQFSWDCLSRARLLNPTLQRYHKQVSDENVTWVIVPKPMRDDDRTWRLNFTDLDKRVFHNRQRMKDGIRLIKWLRNCQGGNNAETGTWYPLSSHIIRTAFLWQDEQKGSEYWQNDLGTILIDMIWNLQKRLSKGQLLDFWCRGYNLFSGPNVHRGTWLNMAGRLKRIANDLEGPDPEGAIRKYFYRTNI